MTSGWSRVAGRIRSSAIVRFLTALLERISTWLAPRKQAFVDVVYYYRGAALPAAGLALGFAAFDQTHEIYLQLAEDVARFGSLWGEPDGGPRIARLFFSFVGIAAFSMVLWHNARWLSLRSPHEWWAEDGGAAPDGKDPDYLRHCRWLKKWTPRVLGALPPAGMVIGMVWTAFSDEADQTGIRAALILGALIVALIGSTYMTVVVTRRSRSDSASYADDRETFDDIQRTGFWAFIIFTVLVALFRVTPAQVLGPVTVICLFGIGLSVILTWLTDMTHRIHIPWTSILVGLALLFSILDLNDNHRIDLDAMAAPEKAPQAAFTAWRAADPLRAEGPVYVVAAQGGGLYAAYHTAVFLARAQDAVPGFGDRLFAVSGVSGGSVGAAVFHAIRASGVCDAGKPDAGPDCHVTQVRRVLRRDFLSPVLASMLFSDFTARFLPFDHLTAGLSRARAIEAAFASALKAAGADPGALLMGSWTPAGKSGPLLLLNTTDVTAGERMVMTPLATIYGSEEDRLGHAVPLETLAEVLGCARAAQCPSPRLLTAALVSARFPIVTPAARIDRGDVDGDGGRRFVDGGYFENSGVETAWDLIAQTGQTPGGNFHLIAMDFPARSTADRDRSFWLGEIMSPIRAFLSARGARGELAKRRAERAREGVAYDSVTLDDDAAQFTLGWMLSARTFDQIEFDIWNDEMAEALGRKCLRPEQRANRELLSRIAGEPPEQSALPDC